jgi:vacuolar iron transporter family protein
VAPPLWLTRIVTASALILLTVLGAVAARVGGASMARGAIRVAFWGALAMAASAGVGRLFGTQVG